MAPSANAKVPLAAEAEVEKCGREADWYAQHGGQMLVDQPAATGYVNAYVSYLPLGPILAIMPWNFPIWQLTRTAIPTTLARNVVLVKHLTNTSEGLDRIRAHDQLSRLSRGCFRTSFWLIGSLTTPLPSAVPSRRRLTVNCSN
jgi:Aldehyde dehydrogenase family